jgi:hypothetical protein
MESEIEALKKKLEIAIDFINHIEYADDGGDYRDYATETLEKIEEVGKA